MSETVVPEKDMDMQLGMPMHDTVHNAVHKVYFRAGILTGTKTSQVARIGNSVCPHVAAAIIRANVGAEVGVA